MWLAVQILLRILITILILVVVAFRQAQGANIITLSGWFAFAGLAAMVMVAIVGALFGIRRLLGPRQQPYTVLVPRDGDA